jgi:hypothetical protein
MVEAGTARVTMGNHEFNAIAWATPDPANDGHHLRPRLGEKGAKNRHQHQAFLAEVGEDSADHEFWIEWFRDLPLWIEEDGFRVVHACWDETRMAKIRGPITDDFLHAACSPHGSLFEPVEAILKGKEVTLPDGAVFLDKDGHERHAIRVKWYEPPHGHTFRTYALASEPIDSDLTLPDDVIQSAVSYPENAKPVFVGHYWLNGSRPELLRQNIACVDWSVAKGGFLCAYRWNGEQELDAGKFVWTAPAAP